MGPPSGSGDARRRLAPRPRVSGLRCLMGGKERGRMWPDRPPSGRRSPARARWCEGLSSRSPPRVASRISSRNAFVFSRVRRKDVGIRASCILSPRAVGVVGKPGSSGSRRASGVPGVARPRSAARPARSGASRTRGSGGRPGRSAHSGHPSPGGAPAAVDPGSLPPRGRFVRLQDIPSARGPPDPSSHLLFQRHEAGHQILELLGDLPLTLPVVAGHQLPGPLPHPFFGRLHRRETAGVFGGMGLGGDGEDRHEESLLDQRREEVQPGDAEPGKRRAVPRPLAEPPQPLLRGSRWRR